MLNDIKRLLDKFTDQRLANLQCAAEDGRLGFRDAKNCLLYHYKENYLEARSELVALNAEVEFVRLGWFDGQHHNDKLDAIDHIMDARRRERILPMIQDEWKQRNKSKIKIEVKIEEEIYATRP